MMNRSGLLLAALLGGMACAEEGAPSDAGAPLDQGVLDTGMIGRPDGGGAEDARPVEDASPADAELLDAVFADAEPADLGPVDTGVVEPLALSSPAFSSGGVIPALHTCGGQDLQPQLDWTTVPPGTLSLALVLIDDSINFVHWIAYDLPPTLSSLPEGASDRGQLPAGALEADAYCTQYCGPCPGNTHTYTFRLYALDAATTSYSWPRNIAGRHLDAAFQAHTLAEARLTGTYTP